MIYYDPHDDSFCAKNLREEEWFEYQRDYEALAIVVEIKKIFEEGFTARLESSALQRLTFRIASRAGTQAVLIQDMSCHWACLALAMMTHGRFQYVENEAVRFEKSTIEQEPMYFHNIEYVPCPGKSWLMPVRKKTINETKTAGTTGNWKNDPIDGLFRNGIKERDSPQQGSLFDLH